VRVTLSARRDPQGVRIIVTDNGPGIPRNEREHIFQSFTSIKRPGSTRALGTGLGLAFCRLAVAAHGGRIWVEEPAGQGRGSAFHVQLPLEPMRANAVAAAVRA
jgi:signal transduction histidine kinase